MHSVFHVTITIFDIKGEIKKFELFLFSSNFNAVFLQNDHLNGLLMDHKIFGYFISKRDLKGAQRNFTYLEGTFLYIQWNLSNPTHQGTWEMCQIVQVVGILRFYLC